jgi:hypothetical protein
MPGALPDAAAADGAAARQGRGYPSGDDWWFVVGVTALLLAITSLPYLYAYRSAPPDREFMGILVNVPDHTQYFAWMRGLTEAHLMSNTLTPEPNPPLYFNLLWWGVGRLGHLLGLGPAGSLQLLRVVATVLFLVVVHRLGALFLPDRLSRRTAFLVVSLTSGFGWILVLLKYTLADGELYFPLDVFIAEGNTFYCILAQPHFIGAALYAFVFELVLRGEEAGRLRWALAAGLVTLVLGWQHAYDLASIYGVLGGYAVLRLLRDGRLSAYLIRAGLLIGAVSWWPGMYSTLLVRLEPRWGAVLAQFGNAGVATPAPWHLVILLGPAFLLALCGLIADRAWRLHGVDDRTLFLRAWFLSGLVLVYLPVSWNVHLINGWQIPIAILATQAVVGWIAPGVMRRLPQLDAQRVRRTLATALVIAVLPTNLYLFAWRFVDLGRHAHPYYLRHDELAALRWLDAHAQPDEVVLSSLTIGHYVPSLAGAHAYLAHWAQTVDYYGKRAAVRAFFDAATDEAERRAILAGSGVDWVFLGDEERALGAYSPETSAYLRRAFSAGGSVVYRVELEGADAPGQPG